MKRKSRRASVKKQDRNIKYGENGYRLCRFCRKEVKPPKRTICSAVCLHEWKLRSDVKYLRDHVYQRDLGQCAICKIDTRYQKIKVEDLKRSAKTSGANDELNQYLADIRVTPFESSKSLWHADHILAVMDGGGQCGIDNIRTLCVSCHKGVTRDAQRSRAKKVKR
jgi:hypothetical protein